MRPLVERMEDRRLMAALALDSSFGTAGSTIFPFHSGDQSAVSALALQADGKTVEAGTVTPGSSLFKNSASVIAVSRLTTGGELDSTFGTGGITTVQFENTIDSASGVAVQGNGDIVVVGTASQGTVNNQTASQIAITRLLPNGTPDTSFGSQSQVLVSIPGDSVRAAAVLIQGDGKIVVLGTDSVGGTSAIGDDRLVVARLDADGSLDSTFGDAGLTTVLIPAEVFSGEQDSNEAVAAAIQSDGKILIGGTILATNSAAPPDLMATSGFAVARLNTDGSLDAAFGNEGTVATEIQPAGGPNSVSLAGLALQPDGKIVLSGTSIADSSKVDTPILLRLDFDGSADSSFSTPALPSSPGGPIAVEADGRIVAAFGGGITKFNTDGSIDDGDGSGGFSPSLFPFQAASLVIQSDGKIVAAGTYTPSSIANPLGESAVSRVNANGAPADYFGTGQTDLAVDNPTAGSFDIETTSGSKAETVAFGPPSDLVAPVAGDFDGDGKTDLAIYASQIGYFAYRPSTGAPDVTQTIGIAGGVPAPGDYAGTGVEGIAVYYPQYGVFANVPTANGGTMALPFGIAGQSVPAVGDFDGSGRTELGYYTAKTSTFSYQPAAGGTAPVIQFGPTGSGFTPAIGDYDGDGKSDLALYSSQYSVFLYQPSSGGAPVAEQFGPPDMGFVAVPGDYDGDGKTDLAIYNAEYGLFIYRPSSGGKDVSIQFGPTGDQGIAVLTAGNGSNLITSSIRSLSVASGSLVQGIAMAPMDADSGPTTPSTMRSTNRPIVTPPTPLP